MLFWARLGAFCSSVILILTIPLNVALAYELLYRQRLTLGKTWSVFKKSRSFQVGFVASVSFLASGTIQIRLQHNQNVAQAFINSLKGLLIGASVGIVIFSILVPLIFSLAGKLRNQNKQK